MQTNCLLPPDALRPKPSQQPLSFTFALLVFFVFFSSLQIVAPKQTETTSQILKKKVPKVFFFSSLGGLEGAWLLFYHSAIQKKGPWRFYVQKHLETVDSWSTTPAKTTEEEERQTVTLSRAMPTLWAVALPKKQLKTKQLICFSSSTNVFFFFFPFVSCCDSGRCAT